MFYPKKICGNLRSWEYLPAAAGTYRAGQLLNVADGLLVSVDAASTSTPPYLCQADRTVAEGETLPVVRVSLDAVYETVLSGDAADVQIGAMLQVSAGGETVDAQAAGSFEVVSLEDTTAGAVICGRFCCTGSGAAGVQVASDQEVSDAIDDTFEEGE